MANYNCDACDSLKTADPNLVVNGFTDTECASLKNDTGLSPSSGHNDCTDLNLLNDCLVGNMENEIKAFEACDWKKYMKELIPNLWTTFKGVICAICGIWTNIHSLWTAVKKLQCIVEFMNKGASFYIGEEPTAGSYVVAGKGCSFLGPQGSDDHAADLYLQYVGGGFGRLACSIDFHQTNFTDEASCYNFDNNGVNPQNTKSRSGNSRWGETGKLATGGELAYELRIKKSQYPQLKALFSGRGQNSMGSAYLSEAIVFDEGDWAFGQHGACHSGNHSAPGTPQKDGYSYGHQVPAGWVYVQCRIDWIAPGSAFGNGSQYTPHNWIGIRINQNAIDC